MKALCPDAAGGLRAFPRKSIQARRWESLTEDELREIELDGNACRLDLDSYESSKERLREIEAAAETMADPATVSRGKRGPAADPSSDKSLAKSSGVSRETIRDTRRHVEMADAESDGARDVHGLKARPNLLHEFGRRASGLGSRGRKRRSTRPRGRPIPCTWDGCRASGWRCS